MAMKIDLITQDFPPVIGGIQTYCAEIAARMSDADVQITVIAPSHKSSQEFDSTVNYPVIRYSCPNSYLGWRLLFGYPQRLNSGAIDAVFHAQWLTLLTSVRAKARGANIKIYCAAHGREFFINPWSLNKNKLSKSFVKKRKEVLLQVDHFFSVSEFTKQLLIQAGVDETNITVVPNGTDPEQFYPHRVLGQELKQSLGFKDRKIIFSICRLLPSKGMDTIIDALPKVIESVPEVLYVLGGSGSDTKRLVQKVENMGLKNHVVFTGRIPDEKVLAYYNMADVFVMMSRQEYPHVEGFGVVFLEANACEIPVIGSNIGGIPDAILEDETGFLVDSRSSEQLSQKLILLLETPELAKKMGQKGRQRVVSKLNWFAVSKKLLESILSNTV